MSSGIKTKRGSSTCLSIQKSKPHTELWWETLMTAFQFYNFSNPYTFHTTYSLRAYSEAGDTLGGVQIQCRTQTRTRTLQTIWKCQSADTHFRLWEETVVSKRTHQAWGTMHTQTKGEIQTLIHRGDGQQCSPLSHQIRILIKKKLTEYKQGNRNAIEKKRKLHTEKNCLIHKKKIFIILLL